MDGNVSAKEALDELLSLKQVTQEAVEKIVSKVSVADKNHNITLFLS